MAGELVTKQADSTTFENGFSRLRSGMRLRPMRTDVYDFENVMVRSPLDYVVERIPSRERHLSIPTESDVKNILVSIVRSEEHRQTESRPPPDPPFIKHTHVSDDILQEYLAWSEDELVTFGPLSSILDDKKLTKAGRIHQLLSNARLGNSANRNNIALATVDSAVERVTSERLPLFFILPAFPFKDQGAFNAEGPPDEPDFGEVALLIRLHCLALAISRIHVECAQWIIASDGPLYAALFGLPPGAAQKYMQRMRSYRDRLNLRSTISIVSLQDVSRRIGYSYSSSRAMPDAFSTFTSDIRQILEALSRCDEEVGRALRNLTYAAMWNMDTRRYLQFVDRRELWDVLSGRGRHALKGEVYEQARETAFRYAACNIALSLSKVIETEFPLGIRATSHAKRGQVAIPRLGHVAPWNGVAARPVGSHTWSDLECMRLHRVWRSRPEKAVHLIGSAVPFFYELR